MGTGRKFLTVDTALFRMHWRDLKARQIYSDSAILTPKSVWLDYYGYAGYEGKLFETWRALTEQVFPETAKSFQELLDLLQERRDRWLRPGGYLVRRDGILRAKRTMPWNRHKPPKSDRKAYATWRMLRTKANRRKPRTYRLNERIAAVGAKVQYIPELIILALAGGIRHKARGFFYSRKPTTMCGAYIVFKHPHVNLRRWFCVIWKTFVPDDMLFLPRMTFDEKIGGLIRQTWAQLTVYDRMRKLRRAGFLFKADDARVVRGRTPSSAVLQQKRKALL